MRSFLHRTESMRSCTGDSPRSVSADETNLINIEKEKREYDRIKFKKARA